ncbi:MAG: type II secretion system F family protein [Phycisphaeraceae bacterium]
MNLQDPQTLMIVGAGAASFGLVLSLWGVWLGWWIQRRRHQIQQLQQRMGMADDAAPGRLLRLWHEGEEAATFVPNLSGRQGLAQQLGRIHFQAGYETPLRSLLLGLLGLMALSALLLLVWTGNLLAVAAGVVVVPLLAWVVTKRHIVHRQQVFDQQFVDALDLAARSLRAGHPLSGTFHLLTEEIPAPVGNVFGEICQQEALGVGTEDAVRRAAEQTPSDDMQLFATALAIQIRSGGNLADMMERLAFVIRDRIRLNRRVQVLTSQAQLSKNVLVALPFVLFLLLNIANPDYIATLYETPTGQQLLALAGALVLLGVWTMNRLARLRY